MVSTRLKSVRPNGILGNNDPIGRVGGGDALGEQLRPLLGPQEGDQSVLGLLVGGQHGGAVVQQGLLELGVLQADVVGDPAVVEDVPLERRPDAAVEARGR